VNRRIVLPVLVALVGCVVGVSAQSGAFMDRFLGEGEAAYGDAAYLVLVGAGLLGDNEAVERALGVLADRGWAIAGRGASEPLTLGEFAFLVMRANGIPGGLMYQVAPGPRYATRELEYLEVIQGKGRPGSGVSGERAARILGRVLDWKEGRL
jgi:hypothetical protein